MAPLGPEPLVSVVMIFLNEERFLQEAIDSVVAQTYSRWELLLVDDGSTDGSVRIAQDAAAAHPGKIRYLTHQGRANLGMSASRNLGWRNARGELLAFLDGDDVFLPEKLDHQVSVMREQGVDLVYDDVQWWYSWTGSPDDAQRDVLRGIGEPVGVVVEPPGLTLRCYPLGDAPSPSTCSILVRREAVEEVGGYEADFRGMFEDQAFLAKLFLTARTYISPECHAKYRLHDASCVSRSTLASANDQALRLFLKWLESLLDREGMRDPAVRQALRQAQRKYGFPRIVALRRHVRRLADGAGLACWRWANRISRAVRRAPTGRISASPSPCVSSDRFGAAVATLSWRTKGVRKTEIRVNAPNGPVLTRSGASGEHRTGLSVFDGARFYLQDATPDESEGLGRTLDVVRVRVVPLRDPEALGLHEMPPGNPPRPTTPPAIRPVISEVLRNWFTRADTVRSLRQESKWQAADIASLRRRLRKIERSVARIADTEARLESLEREFAPGVEHAERERIQPATADSPESARALILLYHRIANLQADPWTLAVTPERFDEQLATLRRAGHVVSLHELKSRLEDGSLLDRSIAVTFDDGYADNLVAGLPLLQRHQVPATVFVTTGILTSERDFWWDDVDRLFLQTERLPATLRLTIAGATHEWDLGEDAVYDDRARSQHRAWRAWGEPDPTARQRLFREVYYLLYPLGEEERHAVVDKLLAWGGLSPFDDRRSLTPDGLLELSQGELIEIGAHTVTHRMLAAAPAEAQQWELQRSKEDLEGILGRPVTSFAYPFGKRGDYSGETVKLVKASGFQVACSNFGGIIQKGTDVHQLPRIFMGDWTGDQLVAQLDAWFEGEVPPHA